MPMNFLNGPDYIAQPHSSQPWLVQRLVPLGGLFCIYGKPKTGKSFFCLGLCEAVSIGKPHFLGMPVMVHGPCMYVNVDTPRHVWMEAIELAQGTGHYDFSNVFFADREMVPYPFNIMEMGNQLQPIIAKIKPVLIIFDTLREVHNANENESGEMKIVIQHLVKVCGLSTAIGMAAHRKKEAMMDGDDLMDSLRGSSYLGGKMDCVMALTKTSLRYQSRGQELTEVACAQSADHQGMLLLDAHEELLMAAVGGVLAEAPHLSRRAQGALLAAKMNVGNPGGKPMTDEGGRKHIERKAHLFTKLHRPHIQHQRGPDSGLQIDGVGGTEPVLSGEHQEAPVVDVDIDTVP